MRPIYITRELAAADDDGIAEAQQLGAAGDLTLDGALVTDGVAELGQQRRVYLDSAGNLSGVNFTVYGTDDQGHVISETLAGPNAAPTNTTLDFATVTRVAADAAVGTDVIVGTGDIGSSPPVPMDQYVPDFSVMIAVILKSGAADYTVQYTFDDVFLKYAPANTNYPGQPAGDPTTITWWNHADLTAQTVSAKGALVEPVKAVRLLTNSGEGELEMQVIQGGTQ